MTSFLFSQCWSWIKSKIKHISSVPLTVELFFNQLDYFFLFGLYSSLFFSKSIKFWLPLCNLFTIRICIFNSTVRILIPNIKNRNRNISSQIMKSLFTIDGYLSRIVGILNIIKFIIDKRKLLPSFALLICHLLLESLDISIIFK